MDGKSFVKTLQGNSSCVIMTYIGGKHGERRRSLFFRKVHQGYSIHRELFNVLVIVLTIQFVVDNVMKIIPKGM